MKQYYDLFQLREEATRSSRTGHIQPSVVNKAIIVGDGKVFIEMEFTTQRGVMLTMEELREILAEVEDHTNKK